MDQNLKSQLKSKAGFVVMLILGIVFSTVFFWTAIALLGLDIPAGFILLCLLAWAGCIFCIIRGAVGIGSVTKHNRKIENQYKEARKAEQAAQIAEAAPAVVTCEDAQVSVISTAADNGALPGFADGTVGKLVFELDGLVTSILQVYEDRCLLIAKTTARSYIAGKFFNGTKEFFYEDLTNVQFREATKMYNGYLQFEYPGATNISTATFGGTGNNYSSENSFIFSPTAASPNAKIASTEELTATNQLVGNIYRYIHDRIMEEKRNRKAGTTTVVQQTTAADEIKKYQQLMQDGAITQEEFDAKKKQLLGL